MPKSQLTLTLGSNTLMAVINSGDDVDGTVVATSGN
jgi:hypothetical protein